ncbi:MAG TPA: ABC transporter substrate-binding protein, partial [Candidatus Dormibacteraeota bacterium]|nr:ABC transporter substrate-binding protein [Candidatus Dormibacteraeota bacterium]
DLVQRKVDMIPVTLPAGLDASVQGFGIRAATGPSYLGTVLMFNTRTAPFDRPAARQAVAEALDLGRIADAVGGSPVVADHGYIHPASTWASQTVLHRFDETAATAGLATLGAGPLIVLAPDNEPVKIEAARQVALALGRAGQPASVRTVSTAQLDAAVGASGSAPAFQMAIWDAPALVSYDPDRLETVLSSSSPFDYPGYVSPAFDRLAGLITAAPDDATRHSLVSQALALLADDAPVVPLFFEQGTFEYRPAIYDRWVFVRGEGILDKLSFVTPAVAGATPAAGAASPDVVPPSGEGPSPLLIASGVLIAIALAAGAVQTIGARRRP